MTDDLPEVKGALEPLPLAAPGSVVALVNYERALKLTATDNYAVT